MQPWKFSFPGCIQTTIKGALKYILKATSSDSKDIDEIPNRLIIKILEEEKTKQNSVNKNFKKNVIISIVIDN